MPSMTECLIQCWLSILTWSKTVRPGATSTRTFQSLSRQPQWHACPPDWQSITAEPPRNWSNKESKERGQTTWLILPLKCSTKAEASSPSTGEWRRCASNGWSPRLALPGWDDRTTLVVIAHSKAQCCKWKVRPTHNDILILRAWEKNSLQNCTLYAMN